MIKAQSWHSSPQENNLNAAERSLLLDFVDYDILSLGEGCR